MTTTFDIVATLQYRENYGAHDWDGNGECPQYWKNKGGIEQVIATGLTVERVSELGTEGLEALVRENVEETSNDAVQTYLIDWELVCFDRDLMDRVAASAEKEAEYWGRLDDCLYMAVASDLGITEYAAKTAMVRLAKAA